MNKQRRAEAAAIRAELDSLFDRLEALRDAEQDAFDAMPESFQNGASGEKSQEAIGNLDSAVSDLGATIDSLDAIE